MNKLIHKIDYNVAEIFHKICLKGGDFTNFIMESISFIAEAGILFLLVGFGLTLFKRTRKIGATILFSVALGFLLTNIVLKNVIARARPFSAIDSPFYKWWLSAGATQESGYSFPSGHTTATTAFAVAIFLRTNKKFSWPILLLPVFMACSRIYLMVHFFTDCLGGIIIGTICSVIAFFIVQCIYNSKIKLFVWARELNLFNGKKSSKLTVSPQSQTANVKKDFKYVPQDKEESVKESLIQQKIQNNINEDTKNSN